jgi:hypothetical protein
VSPTVRLPTRPRVAPIAGLGCAVRHIGEGPSGAGYDKDDDQDGNKDDDGHYPCPALPGFRPWPVRSIPTLGKEFHSAITI